MIPINKTILLIVISSFFSIQFAFADCEAEFVPNCAPDFVGENIEVQECCPESWVGDGYGDCEDQQWGCDLTCHDNDGGDCIEEVITVEIKNVNPFAINDSIGFIKVSLTTNIKIYHSQIQFDNINIVDAYYNHSDSDTISLNVTDSTIFSDGSQNIEIGESILTIIIKNFDLSNSICINSSNSYMKDASNNVFSVSWAECYTISLGCMDLNACNYDENANHHQQSSCIYLRDCNGVCGGTLLNSGIYECIGISTGFDAYEEQCMANGGNWIQIGNDDCGVCTGNEDYLPGSCYDCAGIPNGDSWMSDCGCVTADNSGDDCDDCLGIPNGITVLDECGICAGNNNSCTDCNGTVNGSAFLDGCNICVGGNTGLNACTIFTDCEGTVNGNAVIDPCGDCVSTGSSSCVQGCDGNWVKDGSQLLIDECGICGGDNSSCIDCADIPNGTSFVDNCEECVEEGDISCVNGCDGTWKNDGSQLVDDSCGICGGDNSTCQGCTASNACNYSSIAIMDDGSCTFPQGCNDWCEDDIESLKEIDCNGVCGGGAEFDVCGVCGGEVQNENECEISCGDGIEVDCAGTCGGFATLDNCGVCAGDGSTCLCQQDTTINNNIYCKTDIDILQQFINNSSRFGSNQDHTLNLEFDSNNNGMIEAFELGGIEWVFDNDGIKRISVWICDNCGLMGEIPEDINKLKYLRNLGLSNNNLSGTIPSTLGSMINLGVINLENNHFNQFPSSLVNLLRSQYSKIHPSSNPPTLIEYVTETLKQNSLCTPLSKIMKGYLDLDVNSDYNLEQQSCDPEIHILYPNDGTIRYTNDTAIPIEILVTNYLIGEDTNFAGDVDGHIHYILDGEINEFYTTPVNERGMRFNSSFGVWGHSFGSHNMKLWLVDNNHTPVMQNGTYIGAELSYTISPGQSGCSDISACNFNVYAYDDYDNGSCKYAVGGCCLDECGVCDGVNSCVPEIVDISIPTSSILPLNIKSIDIEFSNDLDSESVGAVDISSSQGDEFSINVGKNGDNRIIEISFNELTSGSTINININALGISSSGNTMNLVYGDSSLIYYVPYLGDYNNSGYGDNGEILDSDDIDTLITYWNSENYSYELGPCRNGNPCQSGDAPFFRKELDGRWDIEDIMAFVIMWNWSSTNTHRVFKHIEEYGIPSNFYLDENHIVMDISEITETIYHIWFQVSLKNTSLNFIPSNYDNTFDIVLSKEYVNGRISEWDLVHLDDSDDNPNLLIGTINTSLKNKEEFKIQYKISSQNGLISSGSQSFQFSPIPEDFKVSQAYPNPLNPLTTLEYAISVESDIIISVYDVHGRLVTYLENGRKSAGYYETVWNSSNHASGLYFISMNIYGSDNKLQFNELQKIMLVK